MNIRIIKIFKNTIFLNKHYNELIFLFLYFKQFYLFHTLDFFTFKINFFQNFKILNFTRKFKFQNLNLENKNKNPLMNSSGFYNFKTKNFSFTSKLISIFFILNYTSTLEKFAFHSEYKLFFLLKIKNKFFLNNNFFKKRWEDCFIYVANIHYFNFKYLLFSSQMFKKETLALNWSEDFFENLHLISNSFLFLNTFIKYGTKLDFFYYKLKNKKLDFFFITDIEFHFKNIHYFKKFNFFTIGLVPANLNPWLVSFAIPVFSNNFLNQFFFFKFFFIAYKKSLFEKYLFYLKTWKNLLLTL